jgi:hypothetical protein
VLNFQGVNEGLVRVARWTPTAENSTFAERWVQSSPFVFSTTDNSVPYDVLGAAGRVAHLGLILPFTNVGVELAGISWKQVICGATIAVSHVNAGNETVVPGLGGMLSNLRRLDSSMYDTGCTTRGSTAKVIQPALTWP